MPNLVISSQLSVHSLKKYFVASFNRQLKTVNLKVKQGFTLIELLIVISIIALLVAAASVSCSNAQEKGRDGRRKTDLKAVQQALETYLQTNGKYPSSLDGQVQCNIADSSGTVIDSHIVSWNAQFSCDPDGPGSASPIIYAAQLPQDPVYQIDVNKGYFYNSAAPNLTYVLSADIENNNDPDKVVGGVPCTPQGTRDYCVVNP